MMDQVSGGSNGNVPHRPPDPYYYYFTILEYLVICCWPRSIDTFDFIFGCFFGYFCCFSPKYFIKLAFNCFSSILYRGTKCKMSHTLVWWRLLLCEVRCFVMIFSLGKSLNRTRVKLRELFYMCLLSLVSCQHVNRLWTTLLMTDWQSDPWNTGLTKAIHFPSTFFAKLFFE